MSVNDGKPVIFLGISSADDGGAAFTRNLPEEARQIRGILEPDELCELVEYAAITSQDVCDAFQNPRYGPRISIFHFGGHPNSHEKLFKPAENSTDLAAFLGQQLNLQMVFLNGCSNQQQIEALLKHVPVIVATSPLIDDQVAVEFAKRFYRELIGGGSIRAAYKLAEDALRTIVGSNTETVFRLPEMSEESRPWRLFIRPGAETVTDWRLAAAGENPMFGLPPLPQLPLPEKPFRYLNWFRREHAEVFFGRGADIQRLYERITTPRTAPIILIYGQSGVGKSSLLEAGLLPRLEKSHQIRYGRRDQNKGLRGTLAELLRRAAEEMSPTEAWLELEEQDGKPLILILDQVEEAYTSPENDAAREMADLLVWLDLIFSKPAKRPQGKLILSFRQEWLAEIEERLKEKNLFITTECVADLDRRGIIEAVNGITKAPRLQRHYGLTIEENLPEVIADDLLADQHSALTPTLQVLLTKLWDHVVEQVQEQPRFDLNSYQTLKKEGLLLEDFLDQQLAELRTLQPEAVDSGLALDILAFHTTRQGTAVRRQMQDLLQSYAHKEELLPQLIRDCTRLSLLTMPVQSQADPTSASRLAHDTLAPLIRHRFDHSERPGQRARRILESFAREWRHQTRGPLLDSKNLDIVEQGKDGMRVLSPDEEELIEKSTMALRPPVLTRELFPPDLDVREFIPDEKLEISVGVINHPIVKIGGLVWGTGQIVSGILAGAGREVHGSMKDGANTIKVSARGQYISFDLRTKKVKMLSKTDEWKSSIVKFNVLRLKERFVGQLVVDDDVFYETKPLQSQGEVEDSVGPFWRALNFALGFETKIQYFEEEEKESGALSDLYETADEARASLEATKERHPEVSDAYEHSGIMPLTAKLGFLIATPLVFVLAMLGGGIPALGFRFIEFRLLDLVDGIRLGRHAGKLSLLLGIAKLIDLAIIAFLLISIPAVVYWVVSTALKNRNNRWPPVLVTLVVLLASTILFWPGLFIKVYNSAPGVPIDLILSSFEDTAEQQRAMKCFNDDAHNLAPVELNLGFIEDAVFYMRAKCAVGDSSSLAPTELSLFGIVSLKWLFIGIGVILIPLLAGGATSAYLDDQKFCEPSNVFLKPEKTLTFPLDRSEEISELLSGRHYTQLAQIQPPKTKTHAAKLELWWHEKAETAFLELTASFKGRYYVIDNKEGKQEEKFVKENWLIYSEKLDRAGAEAFLADMT